jgi:L-serine dehydratase
MKKFISLFDIIGPVMIGPSSSHTAGAARIGYEAYLQLGEKPTEVQIDLYNSFSKTGLGHKTDVAVLGGAIGILPHNHNLIKSVQIAKRKNIKFEIIWHDRTNNSYHPNTAIVALKGKTKKVELTGYSIGGGRISIASLNGEKQSTSSSNSSTGYATFNDFKNNCKTPESVIQKVSEYETFATKNHFGTQVEMFKEYWEVMKEGVETGIQKKERSKNKMFGGDGYDMYNAPISLGSNVQKFAIAYAIGLAEHNAYMGKIVATPTAGSSGILPGVFYSLNKHAKIEDKKIIEGFFIAGMIGGICANKFDLAGAVAGCQAEIGVAGSMAAAAGVYMLGGSIAQMESAASLVLGNLLGLTCDPVQGRVEVPCILRNGIVASITVSAIEMAMNGVIYPIPFDEVVDVAGKTGKLIPACLRETSQAGLAKTPTAKALD